MSPRVVRLPGWLFPTAVLLFALLPLLELALLVVLGRAVGLVPTLLLCASTGLVGAWLARWQGLRTWLSAEAELKQGRFPTSQVLDGALLLVGGVVLLTPGLITDALGFFLLLPQGRALVKRLWRRSWERSRGIVDSTVTVSDLRQTELVEGELVSDERPVR